MKEAIMGASVEVVGHMDMEAAAAVVVVVAAAVAQAAVVLATGEVQM